MNKTLPYLAIIFIILASYPLFLFNVGYFILLVFSLILGLSSGKISWNFEVYLYVFFSFLLQAFFHSPKSPDQPSGLTILVLLFFFAFLIPHLDETKLLHAFKILSPVIIAGLLFHTIKIFVFSLPVSTIKVLPIEIPVYEGRLSFRPLSFFVEPQAFASFIVPFLYLSLKNKEKKTSIFLTICVIISTSVQGIFMAIILWGNEIIHQKHQSWTKYLIVLLPLLFFIFLTPIGDFVMRKIFEIDFSEDVRLTRGFLVLFNMPFEDLIFGIGYGMENVKNYVHDLDVFDWAIGNEKAGFISGFSGVFVQFGLFIGLLMLYMFYRLFKKSSQYGKGFLVMIFIASFSQNLTLNAWFLYFMLLHLSIEKKSVMRIFKLF